jgi:alpha-methylacyl-CoA racemase
MLPVYETLDGEYITLAALEPRFWATFFQAVGRVELMGEQSAHALPGEQAVDELRALFRIRTRKEWVNALAGLDVCCEPVYAVEEALASAPFQALGMLAHAGLRTPLALSSVTPEPPGPAPALGQHTASLLADLGYSAADVERLRREGVVLPPGRPAIAGGPGTAPTPFRFCSLRLCSRQHAPRPRGKPCLGLRRQPPANGQKPAFGL